MYDYATYIADRMHEQFLRMSNERAFKYSSVLYHLFLYYQADKFPFTLQKLDTKGHPRIIIFWTPLIHKYESTYPYIDFIDLFVHPVMEVLLQELVQISRGSCNCQNNTKWEIGTCTKITQKLGSMVVSWSHINCPDTSQ